MKDRQMTPIPDDKDLLICSFFKEMITRMGLS